LNQAGLFWKAGERDSVKFILYLIDFDRLSQYFTLSEKQNAAFLWKDLANSTPNLTPPQQINYLNQSLALDPDNPDALALKGLALAALGQRQTGESLIQRALSIASDHTGKSLIILGEYIGRDSADPALVGEAWIWMRAGGFYSYYDLTQAEKMTQKSLDTYANNEWAQDLLAEILLRQDHCVDALPFAQTATKLLPEYLPFQKRLGDIYWCLGDKIQANQIYQQIIVQDSSYEIILHDRLSAP
jgi:tetratricopeptide (TPR) repeat protein